MRLADECKLHREGTFDLDDPVDLDYEIVRSELVRLRAALDEIDVLNPEDFMGPAHLARAFQKPDLAMAFKEVCRIVNKVLHNTDAYGRPLPAQSEEITGG